VGQGQATGLLVTLTEAGRRGATGDAAREQFRCRPLGLCPLSRRDFSG
jgi:hypothetical protein